MAEVRTVVGGHKPQQGACGPWGHVWEGGKKPVPGWPLGWSWLRGAHGDPGITVCLSRAPQSPDVFLPLHPQLHNTPMSTPPSFRVHEL